MADPMKIPLCDAVVLMRDDRFGGIELRCELAPHDGHGHHSHAMTACEPRAELVWFSEGEVS